MGVHEDFAARLDEIERDQAVGGLAALLGFLLDGDEPAPVRRRREVRIAGAGKRTRHGRTAQALDAGLRRVDVHQRLAGEAVVATAVLVHHRTRVVVRRRHVGGHTSGCAADHDLTPALVGTPLQPMQRPPMPARHGDPAHGGGDVRRSERRRPGSVGGGLRHGTLAGGPYCTDPVDAIDVAILIGGGLAAGVVNTLAGGGSLLTVPLLALVGLPGTLANGTNRVGILVQNATASWGFWREGVPGFREAAPLLLPVVLGAALGAYGISQVDDAWFEHAFGVLMLVLLIPTLRGRGPAEANPKERARWVQSLLFFGIGLYGGAFQAGAGILLIYAISFSGVDLVRTNSMKVVINACFTLVVLPIFVWADQIAWGPAAVLSIGFAAGGAIGPRLAVRGGERLIRPVLAVAVVALAARMLGLY